MNIRSTFIFLFFMIGLGVFSQNKKDVLLTIDDIPVYTEEFKKVYTKNLELVQDESQKDVAAYLDLFIDYKLKISEAYRQRLHEDPTYKKEFAKYEEQLSRNYLYEDKVIDDLAWEAYQRGLDEIHASHILILVGYEDLPQDTLSAYNKITKIRERALAGEDFTALAKETSEEPTAKEQGGDLGYFSVFAMVYPFESMAYNTKVGAVSEIVRTQFGYHILKVNDRRKRSNEITVSHIMISDKEEDQTFDPKERINEIYSLLKQGESFEELAEQYSDDKNSGKRGGKLGKFRKGDLRSAEFEEGAFQLKEIGQFSKPVKSAFGWHIIRLDELHPIATFEEKKENLAKRVQDAARSKIVTNTVNKKIKEKYGYKVNEDYKEFFKQYLGDEVLRRKWQLDTLSSEEDKTLFTIGTKEVTYSDLATYIHDRQMRSKAYKTKEGLISGMFDELETIELKDYFRKRLEFENDEYASIISEYRDGLLIFDVMNKNIWNKAKNDSIGLVNFYEANKENYKWKKRVDAIIAATKNQDIAEQLVEMFNAGRSPEEIKEELNADDTINVIISEGIYEIDNSDLPKYFIAIPGVSNYQTSDSFQVVKVKEVIPPSVRPLEDIRGRTLSDYQNYLEENWLNELRNSHVIEINKRTLKRVIKDLK